MQVNPQFQSQAPMQQQPNAIPTAQSLWRYSEQALIGCILQAGFVQQGRQMFAEVVDISGINQTDFTSMDLVYIWIAIGRLYEAGAEIDLSTIWAEIEKSKNASSHVNFEMLSYLANQKVGGHRQHAENIVDAAVSKSAEIALNKLMGIVKNPKIKANQKLKKLSEIVTDLSARTDRAAKSHTSTLQEGLAGFLDEYFHKQESGEIDAGIPTGIPQLDEKIDGWRKSTLHVIAGAPGSGKSVFLFTSALHAMMAGKRVLFVQLELPQDQSYRRMLCAFAGIDSKRFKQGNLTSLEMGRIAKAQEKLKEFDQDNCFTLLTMNRPTLEDIKIKLDTLMIQGFDIIFFDYAGAARIAPDKPMNDLELHQQIYMTVDSWKKLYNIPIVVGAQYGHEIQPKTPAAYTQDMIYSSSFFKHNADSITFLHRNKKDPNGDATTSLVLVKNRDGETESGGNTVLTVKSEMNMFRFVPKGSSHIGHPQPLWDIHEQNKPHTVDLGDL